MGFWDKVKGFFGVDPQPENNPFMTIKFETTEKITPAYLNLVENFFREEIFHLYNSVGERVEYFASPIRPTKLPFAVEYTINRIDGDWKHRLITSVSFSNPKKYLFFKSNKINISIIITPILKDERQKPVNVTSFEFASKEELSYKLGNSEDLLFNKIKEIIINLRERTILELRSKI